tara:strand:+ start:140 stop:265 length:126 start_codon:yes stop_codon:yes gene_type:complete
MALEDVTLPQPNADPSRGDMLRSSGLLLMGSGIGSLARVSF